jgi:hypothetical protein
VDRLACLHARQRSENVFQILPCVDAETPAVLHDGVEDGGLLTGLGRTDEEPVLESRRSSDPP